MSVLFNYGIKKTQIVCVFSFDFYSVSIQFLSSIMDYCICRLRCHKLQIVSSEFELSCAETQISSFLRAKRALRQQGAVI